MKKLVVVECLRKERENGWEGETKSQANKNRTRVILWRGGEVGVVKVRVARCMWEDGNRTTGKINMYK